MKFCDKLNEYIGALACTAKELSEQSGISAATISRYRSGERVPETGKRSLFAFGQGTSPHRCGQRHPA